MALSQAGDTENPSFVVVDPVNEQWLSGPFQSFSEAVNAAHSLIETEGRVSQEHVDQRGRLPASPPPPIDRMLWMLSRGQEAATAVERVYPEAPTFHELRININGRLYWARVFDGAGLEQSAIVKRRQFERCGWRAFSD